MKFIGRGRVYIAERDDNGIPGIFKFVGCADALDISLAVETIEHVSKCTSADAIDAQLTTKQSANVTMTLSEWFQDNLLLALRGTLVPDSSGGSVTGEACGTGFVAGDIYLLGAATGTPHTNVSAASLSDSGGALVLNTDYTINLNTGTVTFLLATTGAVTANYTYDDLPYNAMFKAGSKAYWVRFDGVNKADDDDPFVVDLYKVQFTPAQSLNLLADDFTPLELGGAVLIDDAKSDSGDLGQFGRMTKLQAVA